MSRRGSGLPDEVGPRDTTPEGNDTTSAPAPIKTSSRFQSKGNCGRHADTFRWGFGCGFRDALRLAARELPPETWHTLDKLADEYGLAQ